MEKIRKLLPVLLCLIFTGCAKPKNSECRLVTGIHVQAIQGQQRLERDYTDPQKMEVILSYLRALKNKTPALSDPERYAGRRYRIRLQYSDGTSRQIFQRADRFLSENLGPWQEVEGNKAIFLFPLLKSLPGD